MHSATRFTDMLFKTPPNLLAIKKLVLIIMCSLFCFRCSPPVERYTKGYTESYVIEYYSYSDIEAFWRKGSYIDLLVAAKTHTYGVLSADEKEKTKYADRCAELGDIGYNRNFYYLFTDYLEHSFQDRDFESIAITSDADYDAAHPAGTPLNDLFYFASSSPISYIKRHYQDPYVWDIHSLPEYVINYLDNVSFALEMGQEPVYGVLSDLDKDDFILLGGTEYHRQLTFAALTPVKLPDIEASHNIEITITDTKGGILKANLHIDF